MNKRKFGEGWEYRAQNYLKSKNYTILHKNWTCRWGEIDLIAQDQGTLVFVEVKYRSSEKFGNPWEAVSAHKRKNQLKAAKVYLAHSGYKHKSWRFDVISISKTTGQYRFRHFEAVPLQQVFQ